ncbi:MAG: SDR family oxidoreductase [Bdellovibrionales bacterium]|nr:SDR family oxidoreductase [Bdellovibrionales bacterium]
MKTLILTGASSRIAEEFGKTVDPARVKILRAGRFEGAELKVDFAKPDETREFARTLAARKPDYLFLNHGTLPGKRLGDYTDAEVSESLSVNLVSYLAVFEALTTIPNLRTVATSSISGTAGSFDTLYAAAKAGLDVAIRSFAKQIPATSRLNGVAPGIVSDTRMTAARKDLDVLERKRAATPTGKFTEAREIAGLVKYLLFESENMNGEIVHVNGGLVT